jgi:RimJ/RimL family protein N-acetyltransferase
MPPLPLPDPELVDDVVRLRPPATTDVEAITAACQDPGIQHYTFVPVPYREADAHAWIASSTAQRDAGEALNLVVADAADGALLGAVGLHRPDTARRSIELGYWVAPWARGRGIAARAAGLLAPWALRTLRFARISCDVDVENTASRRTAERAGFVAEDVPRAPVEIKGRTWMLVSYSLRPEQLAL